MCTLTSVASVPSAVVACWYELRGHSLSLPIVKLSTN